MKLTAITYERNFELARFIFEKITLHATIDETNTKTPEELIENLKQIAIENSSLAKPVNPFPTKIKATQETKQNGKITTNDFILPSEDEIL